MRRKEINPATLYRNDKPEAHDFRQCSTRYENGAVIIECPARYAAGIDPQKNFKHAHEWRFA